MAKDLTVYCPEYSIINGNYNIFTECLCDGEAK